MKEKRKYNEFEDKSYNSGDTSLSSTIKLAPAYPASLSSPFYDNEDNYDYVYNREIPNTSRNPIVASDRFGNFHSRRSNDSLNLNGRRVLHPKRTGKSRRLDQSIDNSYTHNHSIDNDNNESAHRPKKAPQILVPSFANATRCQSCMRRPNLWSSESVENNACEAVGNDFPYPQGSSGLVSQVNQAPANNQNSGNLSRLWKCNLCSRDTCSNCLKMCDGCDTICCSNCVIDIGVNSDGGHVCSICMQQQSNSDSYWINQ
ncbi:hypothetical protein NADFUDRAFT_46602 [Nadsonia fulvescens var. elongata DSM 6958]|uniref:Uncharacterized protein n=1 Tax=Nadsonia fulvescens var. elongata DSM 6958 TaxID=857566 RepID=A0A1E3PKV0_9ASCO|nr:hypothetical protein NADFUDRAFT_46602 [Nadsonia fulvescens var. elongata DSM 6958]